MLQSRHGITFPVILIAIILLISISGTVVYLQGQKSEEESIDPVLHTVQKTDFVAQVLCEGEVQSSENVEIKSEVRARSGKITVLSAIPEGTKVKGGEILVKLDSSIFEKDLEQQQIAVTTAMTQKIQAKASYDTALIAVKEYKEGSFVEQETKLKLDKISAEQEREMAKNKLKYSGDMQARGFITETQRLSDELALEKAKRNIQLIEKQLEVLTKYTKEKEIIKLDSDVAAATVKHANEIETHKLEEQKLNEIKDLIAKCTVRVPPNVSGQVVYHKEYSRRGNSEWILEPGAEVREGQVLVRIPDPTKMEVKALIHEQSITSIEVGMPAEVRVDALNGKVLKGVVAKVNRYAEPSGWGSGNIRKYAAFVTIINPPKSLIPGMNTSVTIQTRHEKNAVQVPVQALYGVQGRFFCLLKSGDSQFDTREVTVDGDNSVHAIVKTGVEEGESIVMNPAAYKKVMELPEVVYNKPIKADQSAIAKVKADAKKKGPGKKMKSSGNARIDAMFGEHDKNSDGTIDEKELAAMDSRMQGFIKRTDANKDGKITMKEVASAFAKMGGGRSGGGSRRGGGGH